METVLGVVLLTILMLLLGLAGQQLHINRMNKHRREIRHYTRRHWREQFDRASEETQ